MPSPFFGFEDPRVTAPGRPEDLSQGSFLSRIGTAAQDLGASIGGRPSVSSQLIEQRRAIYDANRQEMAQNLKMIEALKQQVDESPLAERDAAIQRGRTFFRRFAPDAIQQFESLMTDQKTIDAKMAFLRDSPTIQARLADPSTSWADIERDLANPAIQKIMLQEQDNRIKPEAGRQVQALLAEPLIQEELAKRQKNGEVGLDDLIMLNDLAPIGPGGTRLPASVIGFLERNEADLATYGVSGVRLRSRDELAKRRGYELAEEFEDDGGSKLPGDIAADEAQRLQSEAVIAFIRGEKITDQHLRAFDSTQLNKNAESQMVYGFLRDQLLARKAQQDGAPGGEAAGGEASIVGPDQPQVPPEEAKLESRIQQLENLDEPAPGEPSGAAPAEKPKPDQAKDQGFGVGKLIGPLLEAAQESGNKRVIAEARKVARKGELEQLRAELEQMRSGRTKAGKKEPAKGSPEDLASRLSRY